MKMPALFRVSALVALGFAALPASRVYAWGAVGHETVAKIAENILIARDLRRPAGHKTVDKIRAILAAGDCQKEDAPSDPRFADTDFGGPAESAFVQSSVWLDDLRALIASAGTSTTPLPPEDQVFATSASWHFANVPIKAVRATFNIQTICPNNGCAPPQIQLFMARLMSMRSIDTSNPATPRTQVLLKCRSLKTIVHLVGDLHQPLHVDDLNGDRGGNLRQVQFFPFSAAGPTVGTPTLTNLHSIWDGALLKDMMLRTGLKTVALLADALTNEIKQNTLTTGFTARFPFGVTAPPNMARGSTWDWAWDSHSGAVDAYQDESGQLRADTLPAIPTVQPGQPVLPAPPFNVGSAYASGADPIIREQLKKAGLRLADLVDKALNQTY